MKTWLKRLFILMVVALAAFLYAVTQIRIRPCNVKSSSPDGLVVVNCLPFKGVNSHPLDGCVRVYIQKYSLSSFGAVVQTTVPCEGDISLVWHNDAERSFSVCKGEVRTMTWRTFGEEPTCTFGEDLITYDPHELWARTGRSTPEPKQP
ncbi:MAG: hypothetical protein U1F81_20010 [Verrucomicrobiaceae bacterium]